MTHAFKITASTGIHKGDRPYQQDQVALIQHGHAKGCLLGVVADGMGGRSGGRKASDQVMLTSQQLFKRYDPRQDDPQLLLRQIVQDAHTVIQLTAISSEQEPHSTLAAFLVNPNGDCHWIHAGDSRIYHFHDGKFVFRTIDHSYVQMLVDRGEITDEQANYHPQANVLMGCLGSAEPAPETLHLIPRLQPGDVLLACSDGVWHYFTNDELASVLNALSPRQACEFLIGEARERANGRGDNLSLVIVKVLESDPKPPEPPSFPMSGFPKTEAPKPGR